jgi:dephospho-CoA kinase
VIGLTGGIGSGKSVALDAFRRLGAAVLSSDEVVHRAYADPAVAAAVAGRFGPRVLDAAGRVDRRALAAAAAGEVDGFLFLERLVHPRVAAARAAWAAEASAATPAPPLLVCEVPLLFEAGIEGEFDAVLVVTAPDELRRARVEARGQDFGALSARQTPEAEKVRRADGYRVNDGSVEALEEWVAEMFARYTA